MTGQRLRKNIGSPKSENFEAIPSADDTHTGELLSLRLSTLESKVQRRKLMHLEVMHLLDANKAQEARQVLLIDI